MADEAVRPGSPQCDRAMGAPEPAHFECQPHIWAAVIPTIHGCSVSPQHHKPAQTASSSLCLLCPQGVQKPALVPGNQQAGGGSGMEEAATRSRNGMRELQTATAQSTANSPAAEFQSVTPTSLPALQQDNHKAPEARLTSPKSSSDHSTPCPEPSRAPNCTQNKDFQTLATAWTNSWILAMGKLRRRRD